MIQPNYSHADSALKAILPRFPKLWHKQLLRIGRDAFTAWLGQESGAIETLYTIKSGATMYMVRCRWDLREPDYLMVAVDVIHSRGTHAVKLEEVSTDAPVPRPLELVAR